MKGIILTLAIIITTGFVNGQDLVGSDGRQRLIPIKGEDFKMHVGETQSFYTEDLNEESAVNLRLKAESFLNRYGVDFDDVIYDDGEITTNIIDDVDLIFNIEKGQKVDMAWLIDKGPGYFLILMFSIEKGYGSVDLYMMSE